MPIRIEILTQIVIWLIIGVLGATVVFILAAIQRRIGRRRYFADLDLARVQVGEVADRFFREKGDMGEAVASFLKFRSKAERQALEEAFYRHTQLPEELALTREIARRMGRIREWVDTLRCRARKPSGQAERILASAGDEYRPPSGIEGIRLRFRSNFLARCIAANKLARVPTPEGLCAFVAGLADPHPDVQEICARNLGNIADSAILPVLLEELVKVLEGRSSISVRSIKTALVQFPLEHADGFLPVLEGENRRARFFAVDILREIADRRAALSGLLNKNDFSPALYHLFTERLCKDDWADVRARAAMVIAHFHDPTSYKILETLSADAEWFVRLHTCRAASSKFFLPLAPALAQRLTDTHWLVREAAVRSIMEMGDLGTQQIVQAFLTSTDRFTTEQISEELQRSGLLVNLLDILDEPAHTESIRMVVRKMVVLGKFAMVLSYLLSPVPSGRKLLIIEELWGCQTLDCVETLQICSQEDPDPEVRAEAQSALQATLIQEQTTI